MVSIAIALLVRPVKRLGAFCFAAPIPNRTSSLRPGKSKVQADIAIRKIPRRVNTISKPSDAVAILKLQLPAAERFQFLAGQYLEFLLKDGQRRAYSIANAPAQEEGPLSCISAIFQVVYLRILSSGQSLPP